jgi:hypothetical protein
MSSNKEVKDSTFHNSEEEDLKVEQEELAAKDTTTIIDIVKAGHTSKDILDITDTPDVSVWNKSIHINKGNPAQIVKKSQGRERRGEMTQAKVTPTTNNTAIGLKTKGYDKDSIIDPTNQKDVDEVVNSGITLTDKV